MAWNAGLIETKGKMIHREKASSILPYGRAGSACIAQRYGPILVVQREYGRPVLAAWPEIWSAIADLTGRFGRISDGSGILF